MKSRLALLLIVASCLVAAGCMAGSQSSPAPGGPASQTSIGGEGDLGQLVYLAAQTAAERAGVLSKDKPIVVTTIVSVDDYSRSSTFGRLASQLISNRLSQRGYRVKDITFTRALEVVPGTGELTLSRDASRLSTSANAQAIVAGTYAVAGQAVYLNVRFLKPDDGEVLSSSDVMIPLDANTWKLAAMKSCTDQQLVAARIASMNQYTNVPHCD